MCDHVYTVICICFMCRGVIAGVNYAAEQHVEKKVPSVGKYAVTIYATYDVYYDILACH